MEEFSGIKYHFMVTFGDVIVLNMHFNDTRICPPQKNAKCHEGERPVGLRKSWIFAWPGVKGTNTKRTAGANEFPATY